MRNGYDGSTTYPILDGGNGAFVTSDKSDTSTVVPKGSITGNSTKITFDASRNWTGVKYTQIPSHTHSRGSMNITGSIYFRPLDISTATDSWHTGGLGAFETVALTNTTATRRLKTETASEPILEKTSFDASKNWTGVN